jgi:N-acylneuraminate cytidylyltransferase
MNIGIITLRDGSQRIKNKNMKILNGKYLWQWVFDEAKKSKCIDKIVASTSCEEYEFILRQHCEVIERPKELSEDNVPILPVLKHAVTCMSELKKDDYIIHLDVTKPLTKVKKIDAVIRIAEHEKYDSIFTIKTLRGNLLGDKAVCSQLKPKEEIKYLYFGAIRLRTVETIEKAELGTWGYGEKHIDLPIINDWEVDVDYPHDFITAEALLKAGY